MIQSLQSQQKMGTKSSKQAKKKPKKRRVSATKHREPTIFAAVDDNDSHRLRQLLDSGHDLNGVDANGFTALHCAAYNGSEDCVRVLIEFGCRLRLCALRITALHSAAHVGNATIIEMLVDYGEPVNAVDAMGDTPLSCAVAANNGDAVAALLRRGASIRSSVIVTAVELGYDEALRLLVNHRPSAVTDVRFDWFVFRREATIGLKLLYYTGYRFSETFLVDSKPADFADYLSRREQYSYEQILNDNELLHNLVPPFNRFRREHDIKAFAEFSDWFNGQQSTPMSLKCLSRIRFRQVCGERSVESVLTQLKLPAILDSYLRLNDI